MGRRKRIYGKRRKRLSPLQMEPKVGYFKQFPSEKSKLTTSLIGELSAKKDILSGFGAIDLSRPLGSGTISTTASGVLEGSKKRQDIIGSLGAGYKTKKGLVSPVVFLLIPSVGPIVKTFGFVFFNLKAIP